MVYAFLLNLCHAVAVLHASRAAEIEAQLEILAMFVTDSNLTTHDNQCALQGNQRVAEKCHLQNAVYTSNGETTVLFQHAAHFTAWKWRVEYQIYGKFCKTDCVAYFCVLVGGCCQRIVWDYERSTNTLIAKTGVVAARLAAACIALGDRAGLPDAWQKYGECLSNLWQTFGKNFWKSHIFGNIEFYYKIAIFSQYWLHNFLQFTFFRTLNFLGLTIKKWSVYGVQHACSGDEIYLPFGLDQLFSMWAESPQGSNFERQRGEKTKGAAGRKNNAKWAKMLNHWPMIELFSVN